MSPNNLHIWALIQAELVEVSGFKVENSIRVSQGLSVAYDERTFNQSAQVIRNLAESIDFKQAEGE